MSYNSKRNIVSMAAGILSVAAYILYTVWVESPAQDDVQAWAIRLLIFIGISIGVQIVIQILFHIFFAVGIWWGQGNRNDKDVERIMASETAEDERDKLISLKSSHIGYIFAGIGFGAGLVAMALNMPVATALHIMAGIFAAGSIIEGGVSIFLHERGVYNG